MAKDGFLNLKEARGQQELAQFIRERRSKGAKAQFDAVLQAMASGKPPSKASNIEAGEWQRLNRNSNFPRYLGSCLAKTQTCVPLMPRFNQAQKPSMVLV